MYCDVMRIITRDSILTNHECADSYEAVECDETLHYIHIFSFIFFFCDKDSSATFSIENGYFRFEKSSEVDSMIIISPKTGTATHLIAV